MPNITVTLLNAFTDSGTGGNPAGVVLDADHLTPGMRQTVAAAVGSSETAFVSASRVADFKLDFFTPVRQIAHCGHATVAAFSYLVQQGLLNRTHSSKETIDGVRNISIRGDAAYLEQLPPKYIPFEAQLMPEILASLGIDGSALLPDHQPVVVNTGNSFLLVPLREERTLRSLVPDHRAITRVSDELDLIGYYPFTLQTRVGGRDAAARMFAPRYGIPEESATGAAAGPLACYLYDRLGVRKPTLILEQGRLMPVPSPSEILIELSLQEDCISGLYVGGRAEVMNSMDVPL